MTHHGSCVCGQVRFQLDGPLPAPDACHCSICRKISGHFFVSTDVPRSTVTIEGEEHIRWYHASDKVRRGFCGCCGASLFFDPLHHDWIALAMGAFDGPTQTRIDKHIFTAEKGDYYGLPEDEPQE